MKSFSYLYGAVLFFVFLLLPTTIAAQARADRPGVPDVTPEAEKIRILEDQIAELKRRLDELTALIKSPVETAAISGSPTTGLNRGTIQRRARPLGRRSRSRSLA